MKITHIINPFISDYNNNIIANFTMDSMEIAMENNKHGDVDIELCYTCYEEDLVLVDNRKKFKRLSLLNRSVLDIQNFEIPRKLPLLFDILYKIYETDCDYIIFTNIDIHLVPEFYNEVINYIKDGYDCLTINRVTVHPEEYLNKTIEDIYPCVKDGEFHPGLDCFIFQKKILDKIEKLDFCIGTTSFDKYLFSYIHKYSTKTLHMLKQYLTFHIGDDRNWINDSFNDYIIYNKKIYEQCDNYFNTDVICTNPYNTKHDDFYYHTKYCGTYCKYKEDKVILQFLMDNKIYDGCFLDIRSNKNIEFSKIQHLVEMDKSGYILETNSVNYKNLKSMYKNINNVNILHTDLDIVNEVKYIGDDFKIITLGIDGSNIDILKNFPTSLLHNCVIICVDYSDSDELNSIILFLQINGFNISIKKFESCIIMSKF